MATIADAVLQSESDPEDCDYEHDEDVSEEATHAGKTKCVSSEAYNCSERTNQVFNDMHLEAMTLPAARPPPLPLDALGRDFQKRHPRPPKQCSRRFIMSELRKYICAAGDDAPPCPTTAEIKKRVRAATSAARQSAGIRTSPLRPKRPNIEITECMVRFAGENVTVRRKVHKTLNLKNSTREFAKMQRKTGLGGQLAALDSFLGTVGPTREVSAVEKSGIDWEDHKQQAQLEDLHRDPHAGALERKEFLVRTNAAGQAARRVAERRVLRTAACAAAVGLRHPS